MEEKKESIIFYLCNGKDTCSKHNDICKGDCKHTSKIEFALHYKKPPNRRQLFDDFERVDNGEDFCYCEVSEKDKLERYIKDQVLRLSDPIKHMQDALDKGMTIGKYLVNEIRLKMDNDIRKRKIIESAYIEWDKNKESLTKFYQSQGFTSLERFLEDDIIDARYYLRERGYDV